MQLADVVPLRTPLLIQIEPSGFCNLKCSYCIHGMKGNNYGKIMSLELFNLILFDLNSFPDRIKQFNFCGWGEPLLNKNLPHMVCKVKESGYVENIAVVTNGLLLTTKLSINLIDTGLDNLRISLQGLDNESYEKISGGRKGLFDKLVRNICDFYSRSRGKCELSIKFAQPKISKTQEKKFHELFDKISDRAHIEYIKPVFLKAKENMTSRYGVKHKPTLICPQPFYMMDISAAGNIFPCCSFTNPIACSSIYANSLCRFWRGMEMRNLQSMLLRKERKMQNFFPACTNCNIPGANIGPGDDLGRKVNIIKKRMSIK